MILCHWTRILQYFIEYFIIEDERGEERFNTKELNNLDLRLSFFLISLFLRNFFFFFSLSLLFDEDHFVSRVE